MDEITELRQLPRVDDMLRLPGLQGIPKPLCRLAVRASLDSARAVIRGGDAVSRAWLEAQICAEASSSQVPKLRPVINATGVVLHTNLGRAVWSDRAVRAAARVAGGFCNLEVDLESGQRGGRGSGALERLCRLTGAEAALVVNNCAAAVLLALTALARGREVIVSRGELVEIGGSFRVPDIITSCGARLVEVGTTNRTRVSDYAAAIGEETAAVMSVHPSNFRLVGFVEQVSMRELADLGRKHGVYSIYDVGSGSLDVRGDEPSVRQAIESGLDVVAFSGDKLLGGPQAGLLVGRKEPIQALRRHPLYRALRVDKTILAALEATLIEHEAGIPLPVEMMLDADHATLEGRAASLAAQLREMGLDAEVAPHDGAVGGGALAGTTLPGVMVSVGVRQPSAVAKRLRCGRPAVLCRVMHDRIAMDLRTVLVEQTETLRRRLAECLGIR